MPPKVKTMPADANITIPFRIWNRMVQHMFGYHSALQEALAAVELHSREGFGVQVNREVGSVMFAAQRTRYEFEEEDVAEEVPFDYEEPVDEAVRVSEERAHEVASVVELEVAGAVVVMATDGQSVNEAATDIEDGEVTTTEIEGRSPISYSKSNCQSFIPVSTEF